MCRQPLAIPVVSAATKGHYGSYSASTDPRRVLGAASATNAWNQNFSGTNAGNQNNNNKTNTNQLVRPCRRMSIVVTGPNVDNLEVLQAYFDCRKHKRSSMAATAFEMNLVSSVCRITRQLRKQTWHPGSSMCFAVTTPKPREVWAAQFADRVVHHVVYNRLRPRLEPKLIPTTFACIPGRGTGQARNWAHRALRRATAGWTREAWVLQMDVKNFFTTIDQQILLKLILPSCPEPWLKSTVTKIFTHKITENAHYPGDPATLDLVPWHKSLRHAPPGKGLPIGNLTSQFAANVYVNPLDQYITHSLKPRFYGRYVDDLILIDPDHDKLASAISHIEFYLAEFLKLGAHPDKTHLTRADSGIDFVGGVIHPYHVTVRKATIRRANNAIRAKPRDELLPTVNAYLGAARHFNSWKVRDSWCKAAEKRGLIPAPDRTKVMEAA